MKARQFLGAYLLVAFPLVGALLAATTLSAYVKDANSGGSYGEISLRSYFERGNGKKAYDPEDPDTNVGDYPYVITRPRHLYNLSRLQNLGVFSEQTYFQLGDVGLNNDNTGKPVCYADDASSTTLPYLDMRSSNFGYEPIYAIGSESTPFYGLFDGQNVEIRNLSVFADPQDAGLFGYTAQQSQVQNLYLNNVTIYTLGYTSEYTGLYGEDNAASKNVALHYLREVDPGDDVEISLTPDSGADDSCEFDASAYFAWYKVKPLDPSTKPAVSHNALTVSKDIHNINFNYTLLNSGGFLEINEAGESVLNLEKVFHFFAKELEEREGDDDSSIQASASISFVASMTDSYGLSHSKVVMTLAFMFTLEDPNSSVITMDVSVGEDHGNNIGLIIGHCDGSADNCYAYNGRFVMNRNNNPDPEAEVEAGYSPMKNNSTLGLIGLVGSSVHNIVSEESDIEPSTGKDVGVLDLSNVYDKVVDDNSFDHSTPGSFGGVTYEPIEDSDYEEYLRYYGNPKTYVTHAENVVSLAGQKLIKNDDLGIFTIATDGLTDGIGSNSDTNSMISAITKEDVSITNADYNISNNYYLYYATGEYRSGGGIPFADYRNSFDSDHPTKFLLGHYLPTFREIEPEDEEEEMIYESDMTSVSFERREMLQNYFFRFKLEPGYRANRGFYFSDVDVNTPGGAFMSKYFQYKLVDQFGNPIPAETKRSGIMLRDFNGREVRSFSASMRTFDSSNGDYKKWMFCLDDPSVVDEEGNRLHPASNMVNFKIKTASANVTVVAALADNSKPAAVGVYRLDNKTPVTGGGTSALHFNQNYDDPAYAFFMPREERLAYFDYKVDTTTRKGQIGVYDKTGEFKKAKVSTEATMPASYSLDGNPSSEYGYEPGKPRLFVHTFKLPEGEYCIGSATGESTSPFGVAKLYYVCAQGQDEGQYSLSGNVFASGDEVDNVDFVRRPRFSVREDTSITNAATFEAALTARKALFKSNDDTVNGTLTGVSEYDANVSHYFYVSEDILAIAEAESFDPENAAIENQRLYVAFSNTDRSSFLGMYGDLEFRYVYDPNKGKWIFKILTNTTDAISRISVNSYLKSHWQGHENTWVQLLGATESQETPLVYSKPNS